MNSLVAQRVGLVDGRREARSSVSYRNRARYRYVGADAEYRRSSEYHTGSYDQIEPTIDHILSSELVRDAATSVETNKGSYPRLLWRGSSVALIISLAQIFVSLETKSYNLALLSLVGGGFLFFYVLLLEVKQKMMK